MDCDPVRIRMDHHRRRQSQTCFAWMRKGNDARAAMPGRRQFSHRMCTTNYRVSGCRFAAGKNGARVLQFGTLPRITAAANVGKRRRSHDGWMALVPELDLTIPARWPPIFLVPEKLRHCVLVRWLRFRSRPRCELGTAGAPTLRCFSANAQKVELCLFEGQGPQGTGARRTAGRRTRGRLARLPPTTWRPGQLLRLSRSHGPYAPEQGPQVSTAQQAAARSLRQTNSRAAGVGATRISPTAREAPREESVIRPPRQMRVGMPKAVVVDENLQLGGAARIVRYEQSHGKDTIIYEGAHQRPDREARGPAARAWRGTYGGLFVADDHRSFEAPRRHHRRVVCRSMASWTTGLWLRKSW